MPPSTRAIISFAVCVFFMKTATVGVDLRRHDVHDVAEILLDGLLDTGEAFCDCVPNIVDTRFYGVGGVFEVSSDNLVPVGDSLASDGVGRRNGLDVGTLAKLCLAAVELGGSGIVVGSLTGKVAGRAL